MSDEGEGTTPDPPEQPKPRRRRKTQGPQRTSRFERRAEAAKKTLREIIRLRKPDLDVEGLTFLEVVDRDADAWGRFIAQLAEWVAPFGQLVDLVFGAPLLALVGLAPSVRAARRDLAARRTRKREEAAEKQQEEADQPQFDENGKLVVPEAWQP